MKKIIKEVNAEKGIVQVTILDERFYSKTATDPVTGLPQIVFYPSVSWIAGFYPKGVEFYKWLASKGWDEAENIKTTAGDKGTKVHAAIEDVLNGVEVRIDSKYMNKSLEQMQELTLEECDAILSFISWRNENAPIKLFTEKTLLSDKHKCGGTLDFVYRIADEDANTIHLMDFKTSKQVWKNYELQLSVYKHMLIEALLTGQIVIEGIDLSKPIIVVTEILLLGYSRNKAGYFFKIIDDKIALFESARSIWAEENDGTTPSKKDYPIVLSAAIIPEIKITSDDGSGMSSFAGGDVTPTNTAAIEPTKKAAKAK